MWLPGSFSRSIKWFATVMADLHPPEADAHLAAIEQALAGRELVSREVHLGGGLRDIGPATL
ncbi:xanthine dehydrogenase accessory factor XdhC, partial [Pseudomonas syringae pv. actinidiae ICMP 18886]